MEVAAEIDTFKRATNEHKAADNLATVVGTRKP
jgi:hypothetical protein